jgi:hypothetical protein
METPCYRLRIVSADLLIGVGGRQWTDDERSQRGLMQLLCKGKSSVG